MLTKLVAFFTIAFFLSSCGAMFGNKKQKVKINSNIENARLYVDGLGAGFTPGEIELINGADPLLMLKKQGYKDVYMTFDRVFKFSPNEEDTKWCAVSMIFLIIGPLIDLATDSCWIGYKKNYFIAMNAN